MNIKRTFGYLVLVLVFFTTSMFLLSFKKAAKNEELRVNEVSSTDDDEPVCYWFYVKVRIDSKSNTYKVSGTGGGISNGYISDFEKSLWRGLKRRQIAIGPFQSADEARNASRLYKSDKDKINELPEGEVPTRVHWFAITFKQSDRLRLFIIERAPGSVNTGSQSSFIDAFYQQLEYKFMQIGPFYSYERAEDAKRLYRKNE